MTSLCSVCAPLKSKSPTGCVSTAKVGIRHIIIFNKRRISFPRVTYSNVQAIKVIFICLSYSLANFYHILPGLGSGYFATDGQSASLSWCQVPIWGK
jgi:hypothetical protein